MIHSVPKSQLGIVTKFVRAFSIKILFVVNISNYVLPENEFLSAETDHSVYQLVVSSTKNAKRSYEAAAWQF